MDLVLINLCVQSLGITPGIFFTTTRSVKKKQQTFVCVDFFQNTLIMVGEKLYAISEESDCYGIITFSGENLSFENLFICRFR